MKVGEYVGGVRRSSVLLIIIFVVLVAGLLGLLLTYNLHHAKEIRVTSMLRAVCAGMESYKLEYGCFPTSCGELGKVRYINAELVISNGLTKDVLLNSNNRKPSEWLAAYVWSMKGPVSLGYLRPDWEQEDVDMATFIQMKERR